MSAHQSGRIRYDFGEFSFSEVTLTLTKDGAPIHLEPKLQEALLYFLERPGETLTREELLEGIWNTTHRSDQSVTTLIGKLRAILGQDAIETFHKIGYRLALPVRITIESRATADLKLQAGDRIDGRPHWRLLNDLGGGQHPDVWLAEHEKTGERRVFKFAFDATSLRNLKREVTLGRLLSAHELIRHGFVRILDWQFESTPFFVEMEWVGPNLVEWSSDGNLARLDRRQRLDLVAVLADAIAGAHALGILHKDLKPSNFLIRDGVDGPEPVIGDFGSGRLLDYAGLDAQGITRLGFTQTADGSALSGTPLYVAPELLSGEAPTIQADIYSLGVVLYQIVTGDLKRPLVEGWQERVGDPLLCEDISAAIHDDPHRRLASAADLGHRLRRLERRRSARQQAQDSAAEAAQLRQQLEQRRLLRPWQQVAVLALAVGLIASVWFSMQREQARTAAESAQRRAETAGKLLTEDLLGRVDPYADPAFAEKIAALFDAARDDMLADAADDPVLRGDLHAQLGRIYMLLSRYKDAQREAQAALALPASTDFEKRRRQGELLYALQFTNAASDRANELAGSIEEALMNGEEVPESAINGLAAYRYVVGDQDTARRLYEKHFGQIDADEVGQNLLYQMALGNWTKSALLSPVDMQGATRAVTTLREALARNLISRPVQRIDLQGSIGVWHMKRGELDEAVAVLQDARNSAEALLPTDHHARGHIYGVLGMIHIRRGAFEEALNALSKRLDGDRSAFPPTAAPRIRTEIGVAHVLNRLGRLDDARQQLELTLAQIRDSVVSASLVVEADTHLIENELLRGRRADARARFDGIDRSLPEDGFAVVTRRKLGWIESLLLEAEGKPDLAVKKARETLSLFAEDERDASPMGRDLLQLLAETN